MNDSFSLQANNQYMQRPGLHVLPSLALDLPIRLETFSALKN